MSVRVIPVIDKDNEITGLKVFSGKRKNNQATSCQSETEKGRFQQSRKK